MRRSRPKQHYRKIKTKQGRKRILVNKGINKKRKNYGFLNFRKPESNEINYFYVNKINQFDKNNNLIATPSGMSYPKQKVVVVNRFMEPKKMKAVLTHEVGHVLNPGKSKIGNELSAVAYGMKHNPKETSMYALKSLVKPNSIRNAKNMYFGNKIDRTSIKFKTVKDGERFAKLIGGKDETLKTKTAL